MIELKTTLDTVIMLLVAGGVGFIGGIGAGLLEMRRDPEKEKEWAKMIGSSIILGGIAAVAILYFFPPEETKTVVANGTTEIFNGYSLTKLVALALIVGSAGASFLLVLQKRTLELTEAKEEVAKKTEEAVKTAGDAMAIQAKASEAVRGVGNQAKALAKSSVVESAEPTIRKALEAASAGPVSAETISTVAQELGDKAGAAVEESINPVVEGAQGRILAVSAPEAPSPEPTVTPEPPNE
jgi:hypothetical protein